MFSIAALQSGCGLTEEEARQAAVTLAACRKELLAEQAAVVNLENLWERMCVKVERRMRPRCWEERRAGMLRKASGEGAKSTPRLCFQRHRNRGRATLHQMVAIGWLKEEDRPEAIVRQAAEDRID